MVSLRLLLFIYSLSLGYGCADPTSAEPNTADAVFASNTPITANQVVDRIKKAVTCDWRKETVDTFKGGDPEQKITGIATTFLANMDVLQRAKAQGLNFIITHEPTYYNHHDDTEPYAGDQVYLDKKKYIEENGLIVWRFHDHWHLTNPDGIHKGMVDDLGWAEHRVSMDEMIFEFPEITVQELAKKLGVHYKSDAIRVVGKPDMKITKVGFAVGAPGSMRHIKMMQTGKVDVLLIGEVNEWETVEYIRDGIGQGKKMALILLGHANSEEAGMAYCADWLKTFISEVSIKHLPAGDPFWAAD